MDVMDVMADVCIGACGWGGGVAKERGLHWWGEGKWSRWQHSATMWSTKIGHHCHNANNSPEGELGGRGGREEVGGCVF